MPRREYEAADGTRHSVRVPDGPTATNDRSKIVAEVDAIIVDHYRQAPDRTDTPTLAKRIVDFFEGAITGWPKGTGPHGPYDAITNPDGHVPAETEASDDGNA